MDVIRGSANGSAAATGLTGAGLSAAHPRNHQVRFRYFLHSSLRGGGL